MYIVFIRFLISINRLYMFVGFDIKNKKKIKARSSLRDVLLAQLPLAHQELISMEFFF